MANEFEEGVLVGLLIGEGHFGGDGRQPHVTLRMHVRHAGLFEWIARTFGGRVYGPYHHGGRHYLQWMARGDYLRDTLLPMLSRRLDRRIDDYAASRLADMRHRYGLSTESGPAEPPAGRDDLDRDDEIGELFARLRRGETTPGY